MLFLISKFLMTSAHEELAANAYDNEEGRLKVAQLYNQVCSSPLAGFDFDMHKCFSSFLGTCSLSDSSGKSLNYLRLMYKFETDQKFIINHKQIAHLLEYLCLAPSLPYFYL